MWGVGVNDDFWPLLRFLVDRRLPSNESTWYQTEHCVYLILILAHGPINMTWLFVAQSVDLLCRYYLVLMRPWWFANL